ncbi:MAG: HEAT repeat domain-containing protein [Deltaproteobacteria bacterium]|nr:HEAT repeat domain-containing protein [Deltaproteobacteria bacterium]
MKRNSYAAIALLLGLLSSQIIATIQVYLSNAHLYRSVTVILESGYLPIPNQVIMSRLHDFGPAFFGGIFFTVTVGAGISILTLCMVWGWDRLFNRKKIILGVFFLFWLVCCAGVNVNGFYPIVTSYFIVVPAVVSIAAVKLMPVETVQRVWLHRAILFLPVVILALLWTSIMDKDLYGDIRDNILLSNPVGIKINDFYYDYTLYPAEVFKTQDQKILKTCNLESIQTASLSVSLERTLRNYDYLTVGTYEDTDLKIMEKGSTLIFKNGDRTILRTAAKDFFSRPKSMLKEFSIKTDGHAFFRQFTALSILLGFPLALYIIVYALFSLAGILYYDVRKAAVIASILCLIIGIAFVVPMYFAKGDEIDRNNVGTAIKSHQWQERVRSLRVIDRDKIEIADFPGYEAMLSGYHIPERYWLARALGVSRRPETYGDLLKLLDDPQPTVVCKAFEALGRRGDRRAIPEILQRFKRSDHWYKQLYAYRALRTLGWKQARSM